MAGLVQNLPSPQDIVETTSRIVDEHRDLSGALIPVLQRV